MHSGKPYLTTVVIHIMARTTQLSKEKRPSIITLRNEGQSIRKMNNKKKRIVRAKKHKDWTLDSGNLYFGLMSPKLRFVVPTAVSL